MESAQVVLMKSDPYDVVGAIELSRATLRKMHQNLWWAVAYNVIAFPLAAGVLYPFTLSPEVAALSMSGSFRDRRDQCADAQAHAPAGDQARDVACQCPSGRVSLSGGPPW
ncbi:copper-translocating P-type ATPase [Pseudomonas aeruginosa]|nr:copper-translocating P-type ATPase [Pseudomonas aeruginosa]